MERTGKAGYDFHDGDISNVSSPIKLRLMLSPPLIFGVLVAGHNSRLAPQNGFAAKGVYPKYYDYMSIIDVLTKWALDKLDERLFAKKDVSTEARLKELYVLMDKMPKLFEGIADTIQRLASIDDEGIKKIADSDDPILVLMKKIGWNDILKEERAKIMKFRKKTFLQIAKSIVQGVQDLKFDFDIKKGFGGLAEEILKQHRDIEFSLLCIEKLLADYEVAIEAEDEGVYLASKGHLLDLEVRLRQYADNIKATVGRLLEFAKEVKT